MHDGAARLIETGNLEDDLGKLADCDWIVEAVLERTDIKQSTVSQAGGVRRPGSAISSNTSTIALKVLTEGMDEAFRRDFLITHFFNPPRYMRLLEIVAGPETAPETVAAVTGFADVALGKSIVRCEDSPGFIANRLGIYWMQLAVNEAIDLGLTVEEADAIVGRPMGIPKTGVFGLMDLVGIDLGPQVSASMRQVLPKSDAFHSVDRERPADRPHDRAGPDRPQRQRRVLSAGSLRRRPRRAGDRSEDRANTGPNRRLCCRRSRPRGGICARCCRRLGRSARMLFGCWRRPSPMRRP